MPRGKGVRLQRFKDGGIADARVFTAGAGLSWADSSGRVFQRSLDELKEWVGERAQAGRSAPPGFPRSNLFGTPAFG
jgi:topoisomerase-4 subunit A